MKLTDEKDVKAAIKLFNDMNQLCKTRNEDTSYTVIKGKWYMFGDENTLAKDVAVPQLNKKNEFLQDYLDELKTTINGKVFYDFIQSYKKNIVGFYLLKGHIVFETNLPGVQYCSAPQVDRTKPDNRDITEYKRIHEHYIKKAKKLVAKIEIPSEKTAEIKKMKVPYIVENRGIKMKLSKNVLFNTKAGIDTLLAIYELDKSNNLYLARIVQTHKDVKSDSYCLIINY